MTVVGSQDVPIIMHLIVHAPPPPPPPPSILGINIKSNHVIILTEPDSSLTQNRRKPGSVTQPCHDVNNHIGVAVQPPPK